MAIIHRLKRRPNSVYDVIFVPRSFKSLPKVNWQTAGRPYKPVNDIWAQAGTRAELNESDCLYDGH